ncbi:hypothetical protein CCYA_CCYA11G3066 [Cyanidiococcus yangmingshanensis]|nr:hypothetical protein CCYA_CCYA11G3066 [Cyanidiococcus yangmingshanensis]
METESVETPWSQLLKPLKELSENWSVDIAGELEIFLEKLELLPEEAKLRFADAAVLVQQSADVYGRKVEHLYQLVYRTLETLLLKHGAVAADQSKRKGKRSAELGESSDDEFALSVPEAVMRGMNPASGAVRGALTMTAYRIYLEAEREFRDIADLVPFAKSEALDLEDFEDDGFSEVESELERQENRTLEKQVPSAACSAERHTITVATPGTPGWRAPTRRDVEGTTLPPSTSITAAPWNMFSTIPASPGSDPLDLEQLWLKWSQIHGRSGALLLGIAPEELLFDESERSDSGGTRNPDQEKPVSPTDVGVVGQDMDWDFGATMTNLSPGAVPQLEVGIEGDPNLLQKRRRRQKPRKIPADPWKQLDMFPDITNSGALGDLGSRGQHRPFRKGLSFAIRSSVPRTSTFEEFKKWQYLRKLVPGAPFDNQTLGMLSSEATQLVRRGDSEWARSWMHIIFRGSLFPPLDASVQAHRRPKRHRGTRRQGVAELSASDDESTSTGTDDDLSQDGDRHEASGSLTDNPNNKPNDILLSWNETLDPAVETSADAALPEIGNLDMFDASDGLFAGEAHLSDANPEALVETFEQICRRYLEETATAWRRVQEERTLYQRVESWHTTLRPQLLAAEQRAVFSVPVYLERVGERVRPYRTAAEPIPINVVCADFDRVETCRLFVALLHWAAETGLKLEAATTRHCVPQPAACDPHLYSTV